MQVTNTVFLQSSPPFGFGFGPIVVSGIYATPVVRNVWLINNQNVDYFATGCPVYRGASRTILE